MYVNKCIKCGREFETKNPKRVICPECLYPDKKMMVSGADSNPEAPMSDINKDFSAPATDEPAKSNPSSDEPPRYYSAGGNDQENRYNRPQQGGYNRDNRGSYGNRPQQGGYNRDNQGGGYNRDNRGSYGNRPQQGGYNRDNQGGGYNRDNRGNFGNRPQQGGYNRDNQGGGYNRDNRGNFGNRPQQGGYNRDNQGGGYNRDNRGNFGNRPQQGGYGNRPQQGGYNRGGYGNRPQGGRFQNNRRSNQGPRQLLVSKEQLEQIELLYKLMLPLPNPDAHEVIGEKIGLEPRKVFFGINLVRQKMMLPKIPFPKRKLAISPDQLFAIKNLYEPLLPLPPIGCHKIIASQLKMDEWRVHVGIGLIRSQMGLERWNQEREDAPAEFKKAKSKETETKAKKKEKVEEMAAVAEEKPKRGRKKKAEE